jgi:hypothetical protein
LKKEKGRRLADFSVATIVVGLKNLMLLMRQGKRTRRRDWVRERGRGRREGKATAKQTNSRKAQQRQAATDQKSEGTALSSTHVQATEYYISTIRHPVTASQSGISQQCLAEPCLFHDEQ